MVRNTEKSHWNRDYEGQNANIYYTGDVEKLTNILSHETSKLYSVGNNVVYSTEMTDNGMEM